MAEPKCPYFNSCGGCVLQHIDYKQQLANKKKTLQLITPDVPVTVVSDNEYAYRNRMDFIFHNRGLGFRKRGDWKTIIDVASCSISDERINKLLSEVRTHFSSCDAFDLKRQQGTFKYAVIRCAEDSSISFVLNKDSSKISEATDLIEVFAKTSSADHIAVTYVTKKADVSISDEFYMVKGEGWLNTTLLDKKITYPVQGFFQNNHAMAKKMHEYVHKIMRDTVTTSEKEYALLDLYGGVGTFGVVNSDLFTTVTSMEIVPIGVEGAKRNVALNDITNMTTIEKDAKQLYKVAIPSPCLVITDPPRSGMHRKTTQALLDQSPEVIVYISCNVQQLKKELPYFLEKYTVRDCALFDLFPQTNHFESVLTLVKK